MKKVEIGFFESCIMQYIRQYHPEMVLNFPEKFVNEVNLRSSRALEVYEEIRLNGEDVFFAKEAAMKELKKGLVFSKFEHVKSVISEYFPILYTELTEKKNIDHFAIALISECEEVYSKYDLSDEYAHNDMLDKEISEKIETKTKHYV